MTSKWESQDKSEEEIMRLWNDYIPRHLLPRLYGFELMMAPYTIAHMKLGLKLYETGYTFSSTERARIYLTNSLEEQKDFSDLFKFMTPALTHEAKAANKVKQHALTTVIIGNPPYAGHSANASIDPHGKPTFIGKIIRSYYEVDGKPLGEKNPKWLQDDYVKFMRYSQFRLHNSKCGILGFITNHSYLDNPTFRGMRQQFLGTFPQINILDLHGNAKKKEVTPTGSKDENVFDIQQGVAIAIFTKIICKKNETRILHSEQWGLREEKYNWLQKNDIRTTKWEEINPKSEFYLFNPRDEELQKIYKRYIKVTDIFPINRIGIVTSRDNFVIDFNRDCLKKRIMDFCNKKISDEIIRNNYDLKDRPNWELKSKRKKIMSEKNWDRAIIKILYRPFDIRWIFYHDNIIERSRREVMRHMMQKNLGLCVGRAGQVVGTEKPWNIIFCSNYIEDLNLFYRGGNVTFPLYLYPDTDKEDLFSQLKKNQKIRSNLNPELVKSLNCTYAKGITPREIFFYIYAVLYSNTYRIKYADDLKIDFPRVPFTKNFKLFQRISMLGKELTDLHLLKARVLNNPISKCEGDGTSLVEKLKYNGEERRIYINNDQHFDGIEKELWEYQIGGYQVLDKWLKDRKGGTLSNDDIKHYCKIITALKKTIEIQKKIDKHYLKVEEGVIEHTGNSIISGPKKMSV